MDQRMIFLFKALSLEDESFERDYEIAYDATLLEFNNLIMDDLGYDPLEMTSFFTADANWVKQHEFTNEPMFYGENDTDLDELTPDTMDSVILGQIIKEKHARLLFVFDLFSDRGLFIELINAYSSKHYESPGVLLSNGEAPVQISEDDMCDEVAEMFDSMCDDMYDEDEYNEYEDSYDSQYY